LADPSLIGHELSTISFPLERSKLAEMARALFDPDPVYHDAAAAHAAGFSDIPALLVCSVLVNHWETPGAHILRDLDLDLARSVHGEASWEFHAPMRAGDELTARRRVVDVTQREGKRGGAMTLVKVETNISNDRGELVVRRVDTFVEREA
jgi:acyl dehydratase